ncbi:hypothetical protein AVEN_243185-1 [Araneus ventricosus]|uniref:Uncharacterized protein n=1 Tax=Araneus ventricosus TaxID=182803 RepID=A0A4Y2EY20_ARAVE|nr:hypothetical protein AVEN_243185-1 [Araneus ventricosus]
MCLILQKSLTQLEEKVAKCLELTWRNIQQRMTISWFFPQELLKKIFCPKSDKMEDDEENDDHTDIPGSSTISSVPTGNLFKPFIHK